MGRRQLSDECECEMCREQHITLIAELRYSQARAGRRTNKGKGTRCGVDRRDHAEAMRARCCIWQCIMTASFFSFPVPSFKDMSHKSPPSRCPGRCSSPVEMLGLAASSHLLPNGSGSPMRGSFSGGVFHMGLPIASLISHPPIPIIPAISASFQNHSDSCVGSRQPGGWWRWRCNLAGWLGRCGL
jgi:hypothetical protein